MAYVKKEDAVMSELERAELEEFRAEKQAKADAEVALAKANEEEVNRITIDMHGIGGMRERCMNIGGVRYEHGKSYIVTNDVKWVLEEQMNRLRAHEASTHESENKGRQKRRAYVA